MARSFPKSRVKSLADQVYDQLRTGIVIGELAPGARLVELDIASQLGTSQGPVREALQRLERDGLVRRQAHASTVVTDISRDEMYELFSIRAAIEGFAIARTVKRIADDQVEILQGLLDEMREAGVHDDIFTLTVHDLQFHRLLCLWSGSATLLQAWDPLYSQSQRFVVRTHRAYFATVSEIADTHQPLLDALRARDCLMAREAIQSHIMLIWSLFDQTDQQDKEKSHAAAYDAGR